MTICSIHREHDVHNEYRALNIFVLIGCIKLLSQRALNRLDWHHLIGNGRNII